MSLTLDTLQTLDAIARRGSFASAAAELDRAPSSLSYAVQQLEADLDVLIFDRSGHRARLTPAGQVLLEDGRALLRAAALTEQRVRQVETAAVRGLVEKKMAAGILQEKVYLAWRSGESGRALNWFIKRLSQREVFKDMVDVV